MTDSDDKKLITAVTGGVILLNVLVFAAGYDVGQSASKQTPLISVQGNLIIQSDSFNSSSSQPTAVEK